MKLTLLNNTQQEQLTKLIGFYKLFYICNRCGSVYGSDSSERKERHCPNCEVELIQEKSK
jgi:DNA-directed RNA polymerase subunit RPC12/RpoP